MQYRGVLAAVVILGACGLAACDRTAPPSSDTAVLGGYGPPATTDATAGPLTDARGRPIPAPPAPARSTPQAARSGDEAALAVWVQDGRVLASSWTRAGGWTAAQPLEDIYGRASDPRIAGNAQGKAMAVWRHTVGSIESLRFSRFTQDAGWSPPDVLPGALPRPDAGAGAQDAPRLHMDAAGNVVARWPSGFDADETQVARYVEGQGWTRAASEPVARAPNASAAPATPSSTR